MHDINSIRTMRRRGDSIASISRALNISEPTVRKYLKVEDLSPKPPKRKKRQSKVDRYRPIIENWLEEDSKTWKKQRHTSRRIYQRLRDEYGCTASESSVRRVVSELKEARRNKSEAFLDLVWEPGQAQVDFGELDLYLLGTRRRMSYLVVDFPFSNVGFAQITPGENAECVCSALKAVFDYVGGVPTRLIFDNATGIGRKTSQTIRTTRLFASFAAHYGFEFRFCNPESGNEKGGVESKVGAIRRSLFVPLPNIMSLEAYNRRLLDKCLGLCDGEHYLKGRPQRELFVEDQFALMGLPAHGFDVVRYERHKADKYGKITLGGCHRYSSDPALAGCELIVGISAYKVKIYDKDAIFIAEHAREYGSAPTDSTEPSHQLALLSMKPGGWSNSQVRACMSEGLRSYIDAKPKDDLKDLLRMMREDSAESGFAATVEAMERVFARTGALDPANVMVGALRIAQGDSVIDYDEPTDLSVYDIAFRGEH